MDTQTRTQKTHTQTHTILAFLYRYVLAAMLGSVLRLSCHMVPATLADVHSCIGHMKIVCLK